jgi:thymidine kinase
METPSPIIDRHLMMSHEEHCDYLHNLRQRGRIELIMGTMFSGKSTELILRLKRLEVANKKIMRVKFVADNRYGKQMIVTHSGIKCDAISVTHLADLKEDWRNFDVIGIDEG